MRIEMAPSSGNDELDGWLRKLVIRLGKQINATLLYNTSASNPRITLGTDGLIAYDASGATYFSIETATNTCGQMVIGESAASISLKLDVASATATHSGFLGFKRSRGDLTTPAAVQSGDVLGQITVNAYGAAYEGDRKIIAVEATQTHTAAAGGYRVMLYTRPDDTVGAPVERIRINNAGNIGMNCVPNGRLVVCDSSRASTDANSGVGILRLVTGTGASTDNSLIMGVHDSDYAWIQSVDPGTANRPLLLNPNGGNVQVGGGLRVSGDDGGAASTIEFTNVSDVTARSTGVGTIKFADATARDNVGFIKGYVGTTAYYIPIFAAS